jgi:hypothetical protein
MTVHMLMRTRYIRNLIALRDEDEKALTYTLGYAIANSPHLRKELLKYALDEQVSSQDISIEIEPTIHEFHSRYDILIRIDGLPRLIIEGKRCKTKPKPEQCKKYIDYLRKYQTKGRQRLLLIFDWFEEEQITEIVNRIKNQLNKKLRKAQRLWRVKAECYVWSLTWDKIWEWCEGILEDNKFSLLEDEKKLLEQYHEYLELDRYGHASLDSLELDLGKQLKNVLKRLEEIRIKYDKSLKKIPTQWESNEDYLYSGGENTKNCKKGYIGYKRGIKHVFGVSFCWRGKSLKEAYLYITLPIPRKALPTRKLQLVFDELREAKLGKYRPQDGEYRFNLDLNNPKKDIGELLDKLDKSGFFKQAIEEGKRRAKRDQ